LALFFDETWRARAAVLAGRSTRAGAAVVAARIACAGILFGAAATVAFETFFARTYEVAAARAGIFAIGIG
jgi:hypothetical protein